MLWESIISRIFIMDGIAMLLLSLFWLNHIRKQPKIETHEKERIPVFDTERGLAILLIIAIHATSVYESLAWLHDVLWFALPLFFILSGFLLAYRHEKVDLKKYFLSVLHRIIIPYLFFVILIRLVKTGTLSLPGVFWDALLGRTSGNYYFIPIILSLYILFPLLNVFRKKLSGYVVFAAVTLFSYAFWVAEVFFQQPEWNSNPYSLAFFGRFLLYFVFGMVLASRKVTMKDMKWPLVAYGLIAVALSAYTGKIYLTYYYPIFMFIALRQVLPVVKWLSYIGRDALIVYLVHTEILFSLVKPLLKDAVPPIVAFLLTTTVTAVLAVGIAVLFYAGYERLWKRVMRLHVH